MYVSTTQTRVRYAETDQMGIVYYGNYAQYFEIGRVESMRQLGYSYKEMEAEGVILPVVEIHIKYLRPAVYDDLLTIKTTLQEMPHDHRITFLQEVFNQAGKLLTSGHVTLYFLDNVTRKRTIMPKELKDKLAPFFAEA
ncbi:acyl-CoA thioesterase [Ilyomonas limi]|uniref:Acyl-CoA thioesterase n=1 Tax=Ilyomonas limi TaxID=2575867 RepID=A0A4U3L5Z2_9BACT|nr:thioesterase family protein [Ilyomonas limi]TKK69819.1 acyl-CoA thioesterase [Ilyomonas limi]